MRIAVNTRFLISDRLEGIGRYTEEVLRRMTCSHPEHDFIFFFDRPYDPVFLFSSNITGVVLGPPARDPFLWWWWLEWRIPAALKKYRADLFFSPDGFLSKRTLVPTLIVMHDLAFEQYPDLLEKRRSRYLRKNSPLFARKAAGIATVSEFSREDICNRYGISPAKIQVIYNGVSEIFHPLEWEEREQVKEQFAGGCEYFICVGAIHPRKNLLQLLRAFSLFKRRLRSSMKLILVGRVAWMGEDFLEALKTFYFRGDVVLTGYVKAQVLASLVGAAYALVYPSLWEGFGLPVVEALSCRVPVVASQRSGIPEAGGDAALYFDPDNLEDFASQLTLIYKDEPLRTRLISQSSEQAARFNWNQTAEALWKALESIRRE
ncbi:MAG: glycosyltransferase family 4 protein [Chitinophagaceae bacterium]